MSATRRVELRSKVRPATCARHFIVPDPGDVGGGYNPWADLCPGCYRDVLVGIHDICVKPGRANLRIAAIRRLAGQMLSGPKGQP